MADHLPEGRVDDVGHSSTASHDSPNSHTGSHGKGLDGFNIHSDDGGRGGSGTSDQSHGVHHQHTSEPSHEAPSPHHHAEGGTPHTPDESVADGTDDVGHAATEHKDGSSYGDADADTPEGPGYADGYDPADALVHEGELPGAGPGDKFLGQVDPSRVEISEGLITHVDGRPVEEFIQALSRDRVDIYIQAKVDGTFSKGQTGACVGAVMDTRTGMVFEGINGPGDALIPLDDLHPLLAERYEALRGNPPHPAQILEHAEVKAANRLLWERKKLGLPDDASALSELRASVWFPFKKDFDLEVPVPPKAAPFCANCANMLHEVPSSFGRFTAWPPNAENKLPW
ncbi:hypothetical protein [Streptomyces sp. bgisy159]|uniref:hypothetical protein n=1 Tax=Streptomyces sp. bgisy159 TaxID=3413795 RepID=UPI003F4A2BA5